MRDLVDPATTFLSPEDMDYLIEHYPNMPRSAKDGCPTCHGTGKYRWKRETHECDCETQVWLHKHYLAANIGELYQRYDWNDYHGEDIVMYDKAVMYVLGSEQYIDRGIGLLYWSRSYGTGKTLLMSLVAKELVKMGYSVFFTTFAEMIELFTSGWYSPESKHRFQNKIVMSDVLFLDDIGKELKTKNNLAESTFDHILRQRCVALRPTSITTNQDMHELIDGYGANIFSLIQELSMVHEIKVNEDFRKSANDRSQLEMQDGEKRPIF